MLEEFVTGWRILPSVGTLTQMIAPLWIPFEIGRMDLNIDFVAFSAPICCTAFDRSVFIWEVRASAGSWSHFNRCYQELCLASHRSFQDDRRAGRIYFSGKISTVRSFFVAKLFVLSERLSAFRKFGRWNDCRCFRKCRRPVVACVMAACRFDTAPNFIIEIVCDAFISLYCSRHCKIPFGEAFLKLL